MANITQWLEKIKTAMFGKDVRDAIYNSINSMNNEVISNTSKQKDLETKYNNQIKNMSLANPSMAEVVDARTSDTRTTYSTLGARLSAERVDGTVNLLKATALKKYMDYINHWNITDNVTIDETNLTPHGNRSFKIANEDTTGYFGVTQKIDRLENNTTYTFSVWVKPMSKNNGQLFPYITYKDSSGVSQYHTYYYDNSILTIGKWKLLTYTFTTGNDVDQATINFGITTQKCRWHGYIGDIKLELGSHATDWSPNLNDLLLWDNPIGTVKIMSNNVKPSETIGGTWVQTCQGRNPIGVGTTKDVNNVSKTFQLGDTGGEFVHTQTIDELASHSHEQKVIADNASGTIGDFRSDYSSDGRDVGIYPQNVDTYEAGGGKPMNIVSPFQAFYFWMRTA